MTNIPHKPIGEPDLDDLHEKIRIYAHSPIGHAKAGELGNNYLMDKENTDILSSSIADYAIAEVRKWLAAQPQPLNDGELRKTIETMFEHFAINSGMNDWDMIDGYVDPIMAVIAAHSPSTEAAVLDARIDELQQLVDFLVVARIYDQDSAMKLRYHIDGRIRQFKQQRATLESVTTDEGK